MTTSVYYFIEHGKGEAGGEYGLYVFVVSSRPCAQVCSVMCTCVLHFGFSFSRMKNGEV